MKTIEQIKYKIYRELVNDGLPSNSDNEQWINGIVQKAIDAVQRWIPVSEELPGAQKDMDNLSAVVVAKCTGLADEVSAYLDLNKNVWRRYPSGSIVTVTEWRPIELE